MIRPATDDCAETTAAPPTISASAAATLRALEINEPFVDVRMRELHPKAIADIQLLLTANEFSLDGRSEHADEGALGRRSGDDRVEHFPDSRRHDERRRRLPDLPLHLVGIVFL